MSKSKPKNRREFIRQSALLGLGAGIVVSSACQDKSNKDAPSDTNKSEAAELKAAVKPIVVSTWNHGLAANDAAWEVLNGGGYSLDAVEKGVRVAESDPEVRSVGLGGLPDRNGIVSLDACIMDEQYRCGSVAFLQEIENPISVARKVMEDTPHVMLVGRGAQDFAVQSGFSKTQLLTEKSKQDWLEWKEKSHYQPEINIENHDTIGMLALDSDGRIAGACTTSGAAYKYHGRVGDSPLIGSGLYVDGEVGGACATGLGEAVIRACGSHMVVMLMKQNYTAQEACEETIKHIVKINKGVENLQVGLLALDVNGNVGAVSIHAGFNYAVNSMKQKPVLLDAKSYISD